MNNNNNKIKLLIIFILIFLQKFVIKKFLIIIKDLNIHDKEISYYDIENFLFDYSVGKEAILIFEFTIYHYECTPSYAKYFIDLGYNVDIIMNKFGLDSFSLCDNFEKVKIFSYNNYVWINRFYSYISEKIKKYNFILIETTEPRYLDILIFLQILIS